MSNLNKDGDGKISAKDVKKIMHDLAQKPSSKPTGNPTGLIYEKKKLMPNKKLATDNPTAIKHIWKIIKKAVDGVIFKDEFENLLERNLSQTEDTILKAFGELDRNNDGFLTVAQLKKVTFVHLNKNLTAEEIEELVSRADIDDDGRIDIDQFCEMICQSHNEREEKEEEEKLKQETSSSKK